MDYTNDFKQECSLLKETTRSVIKDFNEKKDQVIRQAMSNAGLNPDDTEMLKTEMNLILCEGDPFEHLWHTPKNGEKKRIISFEKLTTMHISAVLRNDGVIRFELKYY